MIRKYFFNFLIFIGTFFFLLLILEITLRVFHIRSDNHLKHDPVLGWVHDPNRTGRSVSKEFSTKWRINSQGLIGPECSYEKPEGTFRIVALGDSMTEAFQVEEKDSFVRLLERKLNSLDDAGYEVLNFGVTTYGTVKEYYVFENKATRFNPDMVILAVFIGNDIDDNLNEEINPNAEFTKQQKIENYIKLFLRNNFVSIGFTKEKIAKNKILRYLKGDREEAVAAYNPIYFKNYPENTQFAIEKTKTYLKKFKNLADKESIRFLVLLIPDRVQVYEEFRPAAVEAVDFEKPNKILAGFLEEQEIDYIDLLPVFLSWVKMNSGTFLYFPYDGHINKDGHKVIAEEIFNHFK